MMSGNQHREAWLISPQTAALKMQLAAEYPALFRSSFDVNTYMEPSSHQLQHYSKKLVFIEFVLSIIKKTITQINIFGTYCFVTLGG